MKEQYWKESKITNKKYNLFECVNILNIKQVTKYIKNGVLPVDIEIGNDKKTGEECLVFLFNKNESKEVYDKWCKYELD